MTVKVPISNTLSYLRIANGFLSISKSGGMTETEIKILAQFIDEHTKAIQEGLSLNMFHTEVRRRVAASLGRDTPHTLNNYIKSLKDKKVIKPSLDGYKLHPLFQPRESITFNFNG